MTVPALQGSQISNLWNNISKGWKRSAVGRRPVSNWLRGSKERRKHPRQHRCSHSE
jgi:hypothetical protein